MKKSSDKKIKEVLDNSYEINHPIFKRAVCANCEYYPICAGECEKTRGMGG